MELVLTWSAEVSKISPGTPSSSLVFLHSRAIFLNREIDMKILFPTCKDPWMESVQQSGVVADKIPSQLHPFVPLTLTLGLHQKDYSSF